MQIYLYFIFCDFFFIPFTAKLEPSLVMLLAKKGKNCQDIQLEKNKIILVDSKKLAPLPRKTLFVCKQFQSLCLFISLFLSVYVSSMGVYVYVSLSLCISVSVCLCFSVSMFLCLYVSMFLCLYVSLCLCFSLSMFLSVYVSLYLCFSLSMFLSVYVSLCLCFSLSMFLSVYVSLSVCVYVSFCLCYSVGLSNYIFSQIFRAIWYLKISKVCKEFFCMTEFMC